MAPVSPFELGLRVTLKALCLATLIGAATTGQADTPLHIIRGNDLWSLRVEREWAPRTREAMKAFDAFARSQYGIEPGQSLAITLASLPKLRAPEGATQAGLSHVEAGLSEAELRDKTLLEPVRRSMAAVIDELGGDKNQALPEWLRLGLCDLVAMDIVATLDLPPLPPAAAEVPLTRPLGVGERQSDLHVKEQSQARLARRWALMATQQLQARLGAAFHPKLKAWLASAKQPDFDAGRAFQEAFGLSETEWLHTLEAQAPASNAPSNVPPSSPISTSSAQNEEGFIGTPTLQEAWAAFQATPQPRALAISANGRWGLGSQSPRSIDQAFKACQDQGGSNCRLVALDDEVVPQPDRAHVAVQMGGYKQDEFAQTVERNWLRVVRQASAQFDALVNDTLQVRLVRDARIYVAAGVDDYEQVLQQDMGMSAQKAETEGEVSGGLSNSKGQIALKFTPKQSRAAAYELAVKTTLHELTHELQKQLDHKHAGFTPPKWMTEGSADLMAYLLAPQVRIPDLEAQALRSWRERNLSWWRSGNKTQLQPDDMLGLAPKDWTRMMKEKRGNYQMAGLMCMYLQAITGERFLAAWVDYYRLAGQKGQTHARAFEQAFGLSAEDFHADFKNWLAQQ